MATKKPTDLEQYYIDNPDAKAQEAHAQQESERFYKEGALGRLSDPGSVGAIDANSIGTVRDVQSRDVGNMDTSKIGKVRDASTVMAGGTDNVADARAANARALQRDSYVSDALNRMQSGLGGITSAENQALLEQGDRGIKQNEATALRQMRADQGEAGMTGSSAAAQRNRLYAQTAQLRQQNISNLIASNVAEKGRRLSEYGSAAQSSANQMASAQDAALGRLIGARENAAAYTQKGEALNQAADTTNQAMAYNVAQANQANAALNASRALEAGKANQAADTTNASNRLQAATTNADIGFKNIANALDVSKYNVGQGEKEMAGKIGSYYGDISTSTARSAQSDANAIAKAGLKMANKGVGGTSSSSSSGSKSSNSSSGKSTKKKATTTKTTTKKSTTKKK